MGRPITEEYTKDFGDVGMLQRMGIEFPSEGMSIGGINFGNVFRGIKRAVGLGGGSKKKGGDEL